MNCSDTVYNICIIVPTYNNASVLSDVLEKILACGLPVFAVNDGSTDNTAELLENILPASQIISYSTNKGKGYALRQGFTEAFRQGFSHAITIDSDAQHNPADIPLFIDKLNETGEAMVLGNRNMMVDNVPKKSAFGRKFSNFWFRIETWQKCKDTQTGFRLYPLKPLICKSFYTNRFEFEIESLVRLAWENIPIVEVDVSVTYFSGEERISHFRPCADFFRISVLNSILVIAAYLWFLPRLFVLKLKKKTWREILLNPDENNLTKAKSLAFGVFMGIVPIWGFQMLVAVAIAIPLKLNKTLVLVASNISIPPMIPIIIFGSLWFGSLIFQTEHILQFSSNISLRDTGNMALQYIAGSIIFAIIAGISTFCVSYFLLKKLRK